MDSNFLSNSVTKFELDIHKISVDGFEMAIHQKVYYRLSANNCFFTVVKFKEIEHKLKIENCNILIVYTIEFFYLLS